MAVREYSSNLPNTVVMGGGGGGSKTLEALRPNLHEKLTGVVGMIDSGGSTGVIRDVYGGPGWGDLNKNCVALSQLDDDTLLGLQKKFGEGNQSDGLNVFQHSIGNLLLANYHQQFGGDIERIVAAYSDLYRTDGRVFPITGESRQLRLTTPWGETIYGEHEIDDTEIADLRGSRLWFDQDTQIADQAAGALDQADLVVLAPGDWTTSIGPNLVVKGVKERLRRVPAVFAVVNLMNRPAQTRGWGALDYIKQYEDLLDGEKVIDRVIVNIGPLDPEKLAAQEAAGSTLVTPDIEELTDAGYTVVGANLIDPVPPEQDKNDKLTNRTEITHGTLALGRAILLEWFKDQFPDKSDR